MKHEEKIIILGGGIGGLCAAIALRRAGLETVVYESVLTLREVGAGLVMGCNAMKALRALGLEEEVETRGRYLEHAYIKSDSGSVLAAMELKSLRDRYGAGNLAIHRADLHAILMKRAGAALVTGKKGIDFELAPDGRMVTVVFESGERESGRALIGADGIHSAIRARLHPDARPIYAGYTCWRGVADMPASEAEVSESWGPGARFGMVPIEGDRVYWFAVKNAPAGDAARGAASKSELGKIFADWHDPIPQVLEHTAEENILWNDILDINPLREWGRGPVTLLGDAAHATTPNMGQGACMAIEDAAELGLLFGRSGRKSDVEKIFREYEARRGARTRRVITQSRRVGRMGQLQNGVARALRNTLVRMTPAGVTRASLDWLYSIEFN